MVSYYHPLKTTQHTEGCVQFLHFSKLIHGSFWALEGGFAKQAAMVLM